MLKNFIFKQNENAEEENLPIFDNVTILTGDNGSGKTTLLDIIFNSISGGLEYLFEHQFPKIKLDFLYNSYGLKSLIISYFNNYLEFRYIRNDKEISFTVMENISRNGKTGYVFLTGNIEKNCLNEEQLTIDNYLNDFVNSNKDHYFNSSILRRNIRANMANYFNTFDEYIDKNIRELEFIKKLKESILYFPTYRRVDENIKKIIQSNNNYIEKEEQLLDFYIDRRVIGIGNRDIEKLFSDYTNELKSFNSEKLNNILKDFIKDIIDSLYTDDSLSKETVKNSTELSGNLINLAENLNIRVDSEKIHRYYSDRDSIKEMLDESIGKSSELEVKVKFTSKIKGEKSNKQKINEKLGESVAANLKKIITMNNNESSHIEHLVFLYSQHLKKQEDKKKAFRYIQRGFKEFFGDSLEISMDSKIYTINLSNPFSKLSTGQKQLITLLAYSSLGIKKTAYTPLIIIDEPELSLHISWQNKLLDSLLDLENTQFLLATHSPYVAKMEYFDKVVQIGEIDGD